MIALLPSMPAYPAGTRWAYVAGIAMYATVCGSLGVTPIQAPANAVGVKVWNDGTIEFFDERGERCQ